MMQSIFRNATAGRMFTRRAFSTYPTPFEWSTAYATNVEKMDTQHKGLFVAINKAVAGGQPEFDSLAGLVVKHFQDEEAEMGLDDAHKAKHAALLAEVGDKWGAGKKEFEPYAKNWLHEHIQGTDMKTYGKWVSLLRLKRI